MQKAGSKRFIPSMILDSYTSGPYGKRMASGCVSQSKCRVQSYGFARGRLRLAGRNFTFWTRPIRLTYLNTAASQASCTEADRNYESVRSGCWELVDGGCSVPLGLTRKSATSMRATRHLWFWSERAATWLRHNSLSISLSRLPAPAISSRHTRRWQQDSTALPRNWSTNTSGATRKRHWVYR